MSTSIKNGDSGQLAIVDKNGRLYTRSTSSDLYQTALMNGYGFLTSSTVIELTSDSPSAIYYFKNNSNSNILSTQANIFIGPSDGTGIVRYTFVGNATGGTIIDTATEGVIANMNGASVNTLDGDMYIGFEGATLTGGASIPILLPKAEDVYTEFSQAVLPKGASAGVVITPPVGNTSMFVTMDVEYIVTDFI